MFEYLIDDGFFNDQDKLAVGISGGADSMLLLWALIDKQKQIGFDMIVVHVNHHIRENTSFRDQKFVEEFCKKRKIKQVTIDIDVKNCKINEKVTIEEAARNLRYKAFEDVMKKNNLNKLVLAHHKNDQAETILMHIFRGSGIAGASGIRQGNNIIRPFLGLTKNEILDICKDYSIEFVEDETNADDKYSRNFLRNQVIPLIEKVYPGVVDNLSKFGLRCAEISDYIENLIDEKLIIKTEDSIILKNIIFNNPTFIVREYIKKAFEMINIFEDIEAKHYLMIYNLQKAEVNKQIDLPKKSIARRTYNGVKFLMKTEKIESKHEFEFVIGTIKFGDIGVIETEIVSASEVEYQKGVLYIDYNKISNNAIWRTRKLGDVFAKFGTGSKKLNDYFTDKKIDIDLRDKIPVLAVDNTILVVAGEDISEKMKIDAKTDKIVKIKYRVN